MADENELVEELETDIEEVEQEVESTEGQDAEQLEGGDNAEQERDWEAEARLQGWRPDGGKKDAKTFVEDGEKTARFASERLERERIEMQTRMENLERANRRALEIQKEQIEAKYRQEQRAAVEIGDVSAYDKLEADKEAKLKAYEEIEKPAANTAIAPEFLEWKAKNTWFDGKNAHSQFALAKFDDLLRQNPGRTEASLLPDLNAELKKSFPDLMGVPPRRPARQITDRGGRRTTAVKRGKTAADLPPEARRAAKEFVEDGLFKSLDEYAKEYFEG